MSDSSVAPRIHALFLRFDSLGSSLIEYSLVAQGILGAPAAPLRASKKASPDISEAFPLTF